jgi:hypothetical protein
MRVVAVDWSGRVRGEQRSIWLAEVRDGVVTRVECGRTRERLAQHLVELARDDDGRLVVGFDFSFSLPAWFLAERGITTADELWVAAARDGEAWLAACEPPFWGRPGRGRPTLPAHFRATELAVPAVGGVRVKSTFQIGGAGSVGTGSVRGLPVLARLRAAGFRVWPFHDLPELPVVVEVYPRMFTGAVVKSRADARAHHLATHAPEVDERVRAAAAASEDAFDALFTARAMWRHVEALTALPVVGDPVARLEGRVWSPPER